MSARIRGDGRRSTLDAMKGSFSLRVARAVLCVALTLPPLGCAAGSDTPLDLGRDARIPASPDLGAADLGAADFGAGDAGPGDLGAADLGAADLGANDAGPDDLGAADLGAEDAGLRDLGAADAGAIDLGARDLGAASGYRHTIAIDGVDDFDPADRFATTTTGYGARLSWDATSLYVGMSGPDIGSGSATRWLVVYLDTNGVLGGTRTGVTYNTQTPLLPAGFLADYAFRWKADNSFQSVQRWSGSAWEEAAITPSTFQSGTFVETRISFSDLGTPAVVGVSMLMLNEAAGGEFTYAGAPAGTFSDGYYGTIPVTRWIAADRALSAPPNDASRVRP